MYLAHHVRVLNIQNSCKYRTKLFPKNWTVSPNGQNSLNFKELQCSKQFGLIQKNNKQFSVIGVLLQCWLLATPKQRSRTNNFRENVIIFLWFENFYFEGWACYRLFIILKSILTEKSIYRRRAACAWELRFQKYLYMSFFFNFCNVRSSNYKSNII